MEGAVVVAMRQCADGAVTFRPGGSLVLSKEPGFAAFVCRYRVADAVDGGREWDGGGGVAYGGYGCCRRG